ncbi:MAG: hypothetical protein ACR2OY_08060 [Boseongicola sp.]
MSTVSNLNPENPAVDGDGRALKKTIMLLKAAKEMQHFEPISAILDHCDAATRIAEKRAAA